MCAPGTFQNLARQSECHQCPVSFISPSLGIIDPVLFPAGNVCTVSGMSRGLPYPAGFMCCEGTNSVSPTLNGSDRSGPCSTARRNKGPAGFYCNGGVATNVSCASVFTTSQA